MVEGKVPNSFSSRAVRSFDVHHDIKTPPSKFPPCPSPSMTTNLILVKICLSLSSYTQPKGSYRVLRSVDGSSGTHKGTIEVLKRESCRIATTLNEAEVKQ